MSKWLILVASFIFSTAAFAQKPEDEPISKQASLALKSEQKKAKQKKQRADEAKQDGIARIEKKPLHKHKFKTRKAKMKQQGIRPQPAPAERRE